MESSNSLTKSLGTAQEALADLADSDPRDRASDRLVWLERQLSNLILQLQNLIADLDSGMSIADLGFSSEDFDEMIADLDIEISNLRSLIRIAKDVSR